MGKRILNTCGHLPGRVDAGNEGAPRLQGPRLITRSLLHVAGWAGRQAGARPGWGWSAPTCSHSRTGAEWWETPLLGFVGVDAPVFSPAHRPLWGLSATVCRSGRPSAGLGALGDRDTGTPATCTARGPGSAGRQALAQTAAISVLAAPSWGSPRGHAAPRGPGLLPSSHCMEDVYSDVRLPGGRRKCCI